MKNSKQLLAAATLWIGGFVIGMVLAGLAHVSSDVEWLKSIFSALAIVALMVPIPMSCVALVYSLWQFYKIGKGDNVKERKTKIHYTLPLAFPIGCVGLSPLGFVIAFVLAYALFKWARPHYEWNEVKAVLLHREGNSWGHTLLTWLNVIFFILSAVYPILILTLIFGILYLLGKSGAIDGFFRMITNTMSSVGSSDFVSCDDCKHYNVHGEGKCVHGYSNPNGRCPYHT